MAEKTQNPGAVTNSFTKGMVKDFNDTFVGEGLWTHARNAVNNSHDGQVGVIGNEPSTLSCVTLPYTLIGVIHLTDDRWAVFTTDDTNSEIGVFDESDCTYTKKVNDSCLGFKRTHLITGVSRRRFDCALPIYWSDGLNPDRFMDLDNPPYQYTQQLVNGCMVKTYTNKLDCEKIRLASLLEHPCLVLSKSKGAGTLPNGSYQVCIAYTINGIKISDYIGLSNVQSLFSHENISGALELNITSIDKDFDEFELVIISTVNAQTVAKRLGYYSTSQGIIYIDQINPELISIPLNQISLRTDPIERSDSTYAVNGYMLRVGSYSRFQFNYQKQANNITTKWVAVEYPNDYYYKGGNKTSYMRDEQYSFFIRWVYNTGERSASFHIPGRAADPSELVNVFGGDAFETVGTPSTVQTRKLWQVQNTATVDSVVPSTLPDGGLVIASGKMAYWESTELYPADRPDIWGSLCGQPIRHHKMPDETVNNILKHYNETTKNISLIGVQFENITHPLDQNGNPITAIIGYEILRGSREGQKSIVAKGLVNNLRAYDIPGTSVNGLYQNYPYNDLSADYLLTSNAGLIDPNFGVGLNNADDESFEVSDLDDDQYDDDDNETRRQRRRDRREAKRKLREQRRLLRQGNGERQSSLDSPLTDFKRNYLSFHSPETSFTKPFLGINELKVYQSVSGKSQGFFHYAYKHPKFKFPTNFAGIFSSIIATITVIGNALSGLAADGNINLQGTEDLPYTKKLSLSKVTNFPVGGGGNFLGTGGFAFFPNPGNAITNTIVGVYNTTLALAMSFVEANAVGEQMMNVIYGLIPKKQNAIQYDSHGFYDTGVVKPVGERRFKIENSAYIGNNIHSFDTNFTINNLYRSSFVALKTNRDVPDPIVEDNSRFRFGSIGKLEKLGTSNISANYGGLKVSIPSQYGQLESIKQIPIGTCVYNALTPTTSAKYRTDILFGGDIYINRFTEKNSFFFFNNWLMGEPDLTEIDYRSYMNIAYPRFWVDSTRQSYKLFKNVANTRSLDERDSSLFFVSQGFFYLFYSGVRDFYVESGINLAHRDWEEDISKRHYDHLEYSDWANMFRSDFIKNGNYYKYDYSLSISKLFNNYSSWGNLYPRDYDPAIASTCYIYRPKRIHYSLPQEQELRKDNWRIFLANNYKDFNGQVTVVKSVNKTGALFMMNNQSPVQFTGVDQLQTDTGVKLTIGDGGLFQQPLQNIVNSDESYEYGSCQNKFSVIGTTYGVFWVSQNQGKVFQFSGQLKEISRDGMKWWFANYLPSQLLKVYPTYPFSDNPVIGVGVQMIYDNTNEVVYITKKDYKPIQGRSLLIDEKGFYKVTTGGKVYIPLTDTTYFENASWTVSYDPKSQTWISFHDWIPSFLIPGKAHFMSVNINSIWKHNVRCDSFANYYNVNYPFEVEFVSATGQQVNSMRNIEYLLEAYTFHNDCRDKFHILDSNFDQAIIYNSEQVSGLLELELKSKSNPLSLLTYPQIRTQSIGINYSKEENKYRFNQFWDITKNRGEFQSVNLPMFNTEPNGYKFQINPAYVDYNKSSLERKKFRHNVNKVLLRKQVSNNTKYLFKISNQKLLQSPR
jgi:hypothetical protein